MSEEEDRRDAHRYRMLREHSMFYAHRDRQAWTMHVQIVVQTVRKYDTLDELADAIIIAQRP